VVAEVEREHALDVLPRLAVRRHAAEAAHGGGPGVVGGERQLEVVETVQQVAQVARAGTDVGVRIGGARSAVGLRRGRHQLHEPLRAARRRGGGIEPRLRLHHRGEQQAVETVALGRFFDQRAVRDAGEQLAPAGVAALVAEQREGPPPMLRQRRQRPLVGKEARSAVAATPVGELLEHGEALQAGCRRRIGRRGRRSRRGRPQQHQQEPAAHQGAESPTVAHGFPPTVSSPRP